MYSTLLDGIIDSLAHLDRPPHLSRPPVLPHRQANAQRLNSTLADASVLWGYPASYASYPYSNSGCYLHDVINSNFPFTSGLFSDESKASGYTHYDILNKVRPGKLYRYL